MQEQLKKERIAKVIARAGLCSRRDAEKLILEGVVKVNGRVLSSPAFTVSDKDKIEVRGQRLAAKEASKLYLFHKPKGCLTTHKDDRGRRTVFDLLPKELRTLKYIGRLDYDTEGLLLLTNDGELATYLSLPKNGFQRSYRVRAHGKITQERLDRLKDGITISGVRYGSVIATLDEKQQGANIWLRVQIREGKNREVRKIMEHLGLDVNRLIRISYGPFELGALPKGKIVEVDEKTLKTQLKDFFVT